MIRDSDLFVRGAAHRTAGQDIAEIDRPFGSLGEMGEFADTTRDRHIVGDQQVGAKKHIIGQLSFAQEVGAHGDDVGAGREHLERDQRFTTRCAADHDVRAAHGLDDRVGGDGVMLRGEPLSGLRTAAPDGDRLNAKGLAQRGNLSTSDPVLHFLARLGDNGVVWNVLSFWRCHYPVKLPDGEGGNYTAWVDC